MTDTQIQHIMKSWMILRNSMATCLSVRTIKKNGDNIKKFEGKAF